MLLRPSTSLECILDYERDCDVAVSLVKTKIKNAANRIHFQRVFLISILYVSNNVQFMCISLVSLKLPPTHVATCRISCTDGGSREKGHQQQAWAGLSMDGEIEFAYIANCRKEKERGNWGLRGERGG